MTETRGAFPAVAATDEATWRHWLDGRPAGPIEEGRVLVVSPHPDDETFGCGGTISDLLARGATVHVVTVTDGEGSHRDRPDVVAVRRAEQDRALAALATLGATVRRSPTHRGTLRHTRLGLPDSGVADVSDQLEAALTTAVAEVDLVLAPWDHDGHTDHDAVGRAARSVAAAQHAPPRVAAFPIWAWQWATPVDLRDLDLRRVPLSGRARRAKAAAIGCYASQTTDLLGSVIVEPHLVACFERPYEVFADVG